MQTQEIKNLVSQMTLEEKAGMCSGADFWHMKGVERLGIPSIMLTDGPHGVRKQAEAADHLGINDSETAICFPAGCATASGFDRDLVRTLGETLGNECQAMGTNTLLGPAMNIKRSPLCGRNFEYYSEDPYAAGELAAAMIQGVQSKHIGTSAKHFLANNQEKRRMTNSSEIDERTLREIYMPAFETAVKKAQPWTIMSSYNRVNGEFVGDSHKILTEILRDEWGFKGCVVSDWGAVNDRVQGLAAGLDIEMPGNGGINDALIVKAVQAGQLDEAVLDKACERILRLIAQTTENRDQDARLDYAADHALAAQIEAECAVLLKNEDAILPLNKETRVAFIGKYAQEPRYQGGGSSHINSWHVTSAMEAVQDIAAVTYARGYNDDVDEIDEALQREAVAAAQAAEVAVVFAGLPDSLESEGYDRKHMQLPQCQNTLIERILEVQPNVVVVLHNGSPVEMPWRNRVKGILEAYLGGEAVGTAIVGLLYGIHNPCGRLSETIPERLCDTPCYLTYGVGNDTAVYQEGVFVGYRYYTSVDRKVAYPFGYGLSYTTFDYSNLTLDQTEMDDTQTLTVSVQVKNTGACAGKEVVQLYVAAPKGNVVRPVRELKEFAKVSLAPGEEQTVTFHLGKRAFAYWNTEIHDWYVEDGVYEIQIGRNAEEMILQETVTVHGTTSVPKVYSMNSCIGDLMRDPHAMAVLGPFMQSMQGAGDRQEQAQQDGSGVVNAEMMAAMMDGMPLRQIVSFASMVPGVNRDVVEQIIAALNA